MERKKRVQAKAFLSPQFPPSNAIKPPVESPSQPAASPSPVGNPFGGIDDIISMMGKFQKIFGMYQSIQPAFKMISSFLGPTAAIKSTANKKSGIKSGKTKHRSKTNTASNRQTLGKRTKRK
ncbi:hypothetical protein FHS14_002170 [Paenibacillus baekrokdamisoli]|uniref:hypothetical protein n=1 Tax=Paenibacillus baekrokdamisoli TaxID=1712516 RepID=UPI000F7A1E02|nr:hypothetical protein [Paenibacillus baekrokdamisoli]MBB3069180.1 hypothetical protein [Paenibacillus baekrokdamisoli]